MRAIIIVRWFLWISIVVRSVSMTEGLTIRRFFIHPMMRGVLSRFRSLPPVIHERSSHPSLLDKGKRLFSSYNNNNNNSNNNADADDDSLSSSRARNDARIDVRNFLTQRAIQSFLFLCNSVRDPHSVRWMEEEFLQTRNQLEFHGTGAGYMERFGGTWDGPLLEMMKRPKETVIVSAKRSGKGHKGWSKHNPYLEDRYVDFEIDIDPVSLTSRILSVREQIAKEWITDLQIIGHANSQILDSYFALAKQERGKKDHELHTTPDTVFERTAVNILNNHTAFTVTASSPLRKGNFDLLYNLCTQASVHRLLRQLKGAGSAKEISFVWVRDFYVDRLAEYFDGDLPYGRADDFMDELLRTPPSLIYTEDNKAGLADPMGLAEQIIELRSSIVEEWIELMKRVPQDHTERIRKELLEKQMAAWGSSRGSGSSSSGSQGGFE